MPTPLLSAYVDAMPRLMAEESLREAERIAVGGGHLKRGVARNISNRWRRQAGDRGPVLARPSSREGYRAQMAMAGVGVRMVKRDG